MTNPAPTWEEWVTGAAEMEWPDRTPAGLVACSFRVDRQTRRVTVVFHVDADLSGEEHDELSDVEGGILSQLPDDWRSWMEFEQLSAGEAPHLLPGGVLYRRGDVQTPIERWRSMQSTPRG